MNPYVSASLAMCVIVLLSLVATAYMAMYFNKRAKADLKQEMSPLADVIDGELDLEEAIVNGRFDGHIAEGRMATSIIGAGRVFHSTIVDGAGGSKWTAVAVAPKSSEGHLEHTFESEDAGLEARLLDRIKPLIESQVSRSPWARIEYDPAPGHVRLTRPMRTRHDIPEADIFKQQLETLVMAGDVNRAVQHPEP